VAKRGKGAGVGGLRTLRKCFLKKVTFALDLADEVNEASVTR